MKEPDWIKTLTDQSRIMGPRVFRDDQEFTLAGAAEVVRRFFEYLARVKRTQQWAASAMGETFPRLNAALNTKVSEPIIRAVDKWLEAQALKESAPRPALFVKTGVAEQIFAVARYCRENGSITEQLIKLHDQMALLAASPADKEPLAAAQGQAAEIRAASQKFVGDANAAIPTLKLGAPGDFDARLEDLTQKLKSATASYFGALSALNNYRPSIPAGDQGDATQVVDNTADLQKTVDDQYQIVAAIKAQRDQLEALLPLQKGYKDSVAAIGQLYTQTQGNKAIEEAVGAWTTLRDTVASTGQAIADSFLKTTSKAGEDLTRQGAALTNAVQTPLEKFNAAKQSAQTLLDAKVITPETFDRVNKQITDDYAKAQAEMTRTADDANAQRVEAANQAAVLMAQGTDKQIAEAQLAYDRDVAALKKRLDTEKDFQEQYDLLIAALEFNLAQTKLKIQTDADAKLQQVQAEQARQEQQAQQQAIDFQNKKQDVAGQVAVLTAQKSSDAQLAQIRLDVAREQQAWDQYYKQGLIDLTQYKAAQAAITKEGDDKMAQVDGNFFQGALKGFQDAASGAMTQYQIGQKAAQDFTDSLGDTFVSIVNGTQKAGDAFKKFALGVIQDIADMEIKAATAKIVGGIIGGLFGSFGGGAGAAGTAISGAASEVNIPSGTAFANKGGLIGHYGLGGVVGGWPFGLDKDTIPAMLTAGEFVVRRAAVQQPGIQGLLEGINSGQTAMQAQTSATMAAISGASGPAAAGTASGGVRTHQILPAVVATPNTLATLLAGGGDALIDHLRSNKGRVNAALK